MDVLYLTTSEELIDFCARARASHMLAVDTEFLREKTYFPKLCLIQVSTGQEIVVVDPILIDDLTPLKSLFENPNIVKIFHACSQDLEVLLEKMDCECAPVFDTQVAAAFLGLRQQVSYASLVESYTSVKLAKAESLTDWSKRPLDKEQLIYAEDDVRYLPDIYQQMIDQLIKADRLSWVKPEMDAHTNLDQYRRDPYQAYIRLKRSGSLTRRQLAIAQEICAWREETAAKRDVPRKWILSDEIIIELCRRAPTSSERLKKIRGTEQISPGGIIHLLDAIKRGQKVPADQCPKIEHHSHPSVGSEGVVELMYSLVRIVSEKEGIASPLIANKDDLIDLLLNKDGAKLKKGWRYNLVGKQLMGLLDGEVGLTVKNGRVELL
ncbi:MAG: ribonuclease D [Atopobiaceae bacterium]|nr:ribonuclease D [Atopobiaceae bacterium]